MFKTLYCFFVIEHGRRRILHFNCTAHPTSDWIVQQLRGALPLPCRFRYALFDREYETALRPTATFKQNAELGSKRILRKRDLTGTSFLRK